MGVNKPLSGHWTPSGRAQLDRPSRSRAPFLSTIGKYFLFVRTGIGAPQIDPGDFNHARPVSGIIFTPCVSGRCDSFDIMCVCVCVHARTMSKVLHLPLMQGVKRGYYLV